MEKCKAVGEEMAGVKIKDDSLYVIFGRVSLYQGQYLEAFIAKHGRSRPVFGPVTRKDVQDGWSDVYPFAFMAERTTQEQRDFLREHTLSVSFECDMAEGI